MEIEGDRRGGGRKVEGVKGEDVYMPEPLATIKFVNELRS